MSLRSLRSLKRKNNETMKQAFLLFISIFTTLCTAAREINLETDFSCLDTVVARRATYIAAKQHVIDGIKQNMAAATTAFDRYIVYKHLYDEYLKFNPDSAQHYALLCQRQALQAGMKNEYISALIDQALITIYQGDYYKAGRQLQAIGDIEKLSPSMQPKLAVTYLSFYMRVTTMYYSVDVQPQNIQTARDMWHKYSRYIPRQSWMYCVYETLIIKVDNSRTLLRLLPDVKKPSYQASMIYFALAESYKKQNNSKLYCHYLILSARSDIETANREAQSLVVIVNSPFVDRGSRRAFDYVMVCTENAYYYKDWGRSLNILSAHATITKAFGERLENKSAMLTLIVVLLCASLIVIGFLLHNVLKKRRSLAQMLSRQQQISTRLQEMIEKEQHMQQQLQTSNKSLQDEIALRNSSFINVYQLVTQFIASVQNFRKQVFNLITAGKVDKARRELASMSWADTYLRDFYRHFDKAFLLSHPDFVERFNNLLKPECRIEQPADGTLTPELRIYALVSIGITDSISIAAFLQYSPQTIYNYRLKVRHKARIPEKNFAETVAKMYASEA